MSIECWNESMSYETSYGKKNLFGLKKKKKKKKRKNINKYEKIGNYKRLVFLISRSNEKAF